MSGAESLLVKGLFRKGNCCVAVCAVKSPVPDRYVNISTLSRPSEYV